MFKCVLGLAGLLLVALTTTASACGHEYCHGAVAIGPAGEWGYSTGQWSEEQAYNVAQDGCGWGCTVVQTFYNTCGAIAVGDDGAWGFGTEWNRELAESTAMSYCMDNGRNCRPYVWACSQ